MASITISCEGTEEKFALETPSVTLGRGLESDIRLKDIKASRRHCQIVKQGAGFQVLDLSSGNGTFINGVQVKQQALNPGDKIQIGSTTITFHAAEAAPAKAPGAARTGATQAVKAATSQSKVATAQLPIAATKKITARAEVAKPTTQAVARAQTQAVRKPGTQPIPKAEGGEKTGTGAIKKTTGRVPGSTSRSMSKASATQKFHKEARKGKSNPITMILVGIGVIFLGVLGFVLFGSSGSNEAQAQHEKYEQVKAEAASLESAGKYAEAIKKYKAAIQMGEGYDRYKSDVMTMKATIKTIEETMKIVAEAGVRFTDFEKKFEARKTEQLRDLWKEGKDLQAAIGDAEFDWKKSLKVMLERIDKELDTERQMAKQQDFQVIRNDIVEKHRLGSNKGDAQYSEAVKAWKAYLAQPAADKGKTEQALQSIQLNAKDEYKRLEGRLRRNADKAAALAEAEKQFPRFELTDVNADFKKLIEELKAK